LDNKNVRKTLWNVQNKYFRKSAQKKEKSSKKAKEEKKIQIFKGKYIRICVEDKRKGSTEGNYFGNKCTEGQMKGNLCRRK